MSFNFKTEVLKEICSDFSLPDKKSSGIVRIENEDGVSTLFISTVNVKCVFEGDFYFLLLQGGKVIFSYEFGKRISTYSTALEECLDLAVGYTSAIYYVKDNIPITFLFASCENYSITDCKKRIAEMCLEKIKVEKEKEEIKSEKKQQDNYDDEAVATVDYYSLEKSIEEKLSAISDMEEEKEIFYLKEKKELDELFDKFPRLESLEKNFPESTWVKINYSTDKFYVVGLVKENGKEKYICYGVPTDYSTEPPIELKGYCSFVPEDLFNVKGKGYWMMFQDAITGECVHLENQKKEE